MRNCGLNISTNDSLKIDPSSVARQRSKGARSFRGQKILKPGHRIF